MKILIATFLLCITNFVLAQLDLSTTKHDFGNLMPYENRYVDISIENQGSKKEYVLRVNKPNEVDYISSGAFIEAKEKGVLRFQVNPKTKGKFSFEAQIFLSDREEPISIRLSGNMLENPLNSVDNLTSCPDFNQQTAGSDRSQFKLTVVVIDKETKQELPNSTVSLIQNGQPILTQRTDNSGSFQKSVPLGLTYFYASNPAYLSNELGAYINFKRNYIVLELSQKKEALPIIPEIIDSSEVIVKNDENHLDSLIKKDVVIALPTLAGLDPENFSEEFFTPVNVVFILDISSSMTQADKIELMKYALFQLTDMLRPQDRMAIVTYANDATVLMGSTSAGDKEVIKNKVQSIKGGGMTAGGTGIKLGFKEAERSRIENGANHVIIITDGAFNRNSEDYQKQIKKYQRKGITMSVVGIKNQDRDKEEMENVAQLGDGRYIPIFKLADAQNNLKQEIRFIALKR